MGAARRGPAVRAGRAGQAENVAGREALPVAVDQCRPPSFVTPTPGAATPAGFPIPITMQSEALLHESKAGVPGPG